MNIGGIGAMGLAGAPMAAGPIAVGSMGGLNGPLANFSVAGLQGMAGSRMDQLMQVLGDFTSAEILMALMLSARSKRDCDRCDDGGLGLLLGLSLAAKLGQMTPQLMGPSADIAAPATGQTINLTA